MSIIPPLARQQSEDIANKILTRLEQEEVEVPGWLRAAAGDPEVLKAFTRLLRTVGTDDWTRKIQDRAERFPVVSGRSPNWRRVGFDDLVFVPAQLARRPVDYFVEDIAARTVVGKNSERPVTLETPIVMGAMSFGALSREAKTALAKASGLAGTMENTGEGGVLSEEREFSGKLIIQYSTGRFGISREVLEKADAIEIKIGQGGKPGQGGLLKKEKITEDIAEVRKVPRDEDIHSPAYHPDIEDIDALKERIDELRESTGGVPIILKLGAPIAEDVEMAVSAGPDVIAVDGMGGGTGAAPEVMLDEVGNPTIAALVEARKTLDRLGAGQELWVGGGLNTGGDFAKALALGADAVFVGFPLLIAMGCLYCRECYTGDCPKGITTQKPELRARLDVEEASRSVARYIRHCTEEIKMVAGACGEEDIHRLSGDHLRALTSDMSRIAGVRLVGD